MPGTKVRKIKPTICLKAGMSKPRAASPISPSMASNRLKQSAKHLLISQSLIGVNGHRLFRFTNLVFSRPFFVMVCNSCVSSFCGSCNKQSTMKYTTIPIHIPAMKLTSNQPYYY